MGDRFTINLYREQSTLKTRKINNFFEFFFYNLIDWCVIDNNQLKKKKKKLFRIFFYNLIDWCVIDNNPLKKKKKKLFRIEEKF